MTSASQLKSSAGRRQAGKLPPGAFGRVLSEEEVQRALVRHLEYRAAAGVVWFAVPNGGGRTPADGGVLKATGVRAGIPDLVFIRAGQVFMLELKRERGGRVSPAQSQVHDELRAAGATVAVAAGIDEAIETLRDWGILR